MNITYEHDIMYFWLRYAAIALYVTSAVKTAFLNRVYFGGCMVNYRRIIKTSSLHKYFKTPKQLYRINT